MELKKDYPRWLPDLINLNGDWQNEIVPKLYKYFSDDFKSGSLCFTNIPVWIDYKKEEGDKYEEIFWHLISKAVDNNGTNDRIPDFRRSERLRWCATMIRNHTKNDLKIWRIIEGRNLNLYIWLENYDYVVILKIIPKHRKTVAFLKTAFYLDNPNMRRRLQKKYKNREL